jgi:hypothetical protein
MKSIIEIGIALIALMIIAAIAYSRILSWQFSKNVFKLFANSENISDNVFTYQQLANVPEPVKRYFKHVLNDGQPYVSYLRLTHDGKFKSDLKKDWTAITGEEYFTVGQPGFIWKGKTNLFTALDMYVAKKGRLVVFLFSLFKIADSQGDKFNQGEMLRWLGENVWFPTNLLPGENLKWQPINNTSAKLIYKYNNLSLFYTVMFNDKNEIEQMETERYMEEGGLQKWVVKCGNYQKRNGILVPITAEVLWRLEEGDFSYAKFNVKKFEYNEPIRF